MDALKAIEAEYAVKMAEAKKAVAEEAEPTIRDAVDTLKAMNEFAPDLVERMLKQAGLMNNDKGNGRTGGGRMSKAEKMELVKGLQSSLKGKMSRGQICEALGIAPAQWGTVHKAAKASGLKIGEEGERSGRVYFLK